MLHAEANKLEHTRVEAVRGEARPEATRLQLPAELLTDEQTSGLMEAGEAKFVPSDMDATGALPDASMRAPSAPLADVLIRGTAAASAPVRLSPANIPPTPAVRPVVQPSRQQPAAAQPAPVQPVRPTTIATHTPQDSVQSQLEELAQLTGYQLDYLGGSGAGPVRLHADLGPYSYDVVIALSESEMHHPAFVQATYNPLLTWEVENTSGVPRFTHEALTALLEHARLAPLTPIDLRGYWNTPSFDLGSVASIAELVSAYLAQRGTFTYVLSTLAQQSAHTLVDPQQLAQRLGSGVNTVELRSVLDTLSRPPFMALLPLPGGHYYLRAEVSELLSELSDYTAGVARRLQGMKGR